VEMSIHSLLEGVTRAIGAVAVIDVFRALITAAVALANGASSIVMVHAVEEALALRDALSPHRRRERPVAILTRTLINDFSCRHLVRLRDIGKRLNRVCFCGRKSSHLSRPASHRGNPKGNRCLHWGLRNQGGTV
jgi:hypothetical protein